MREIYVADAVTIDIVVWLYDSGLIQLTGSSFKNQPIVGDLTDDHDSVVLWKQHSLDRD